MSHEIKEPGTGKLLLKIDAEGAPKFHASIKYALEHCAVELKPIVLMAQTLLKPKRPDENSLPDYFLAQRSQMINMQRRIDELTLTLRVERARSESMAGTMAESSF